MSEMGMQSYAVRSAAPAMMPVLNEPPPLAADVQAEAVEFRQLQGPRDIGRILHLREEIKLPAAALGDSSFAMREKKETKSAWSAVFSGAVSSSAPSACSP